MADKRTRQRIVAASGLALFVLGFLIVVGFGKPLFVAFLMLAGLGTVAVFVTLGREQPNGRALVARAAGPAGALLGTATSVSRAVGKEAVRRARKVKAPRPSRPRVERRRAVELNARGAELRRRGDYAAAVESHCAALVIMEQARDRRGAALTLNSLALAQAAAGQDAAALATFEEALTILRQLDDREREGHVVANLGFVHLRRGRREEATQCLRAALDQLRPDSREYRRVESELRRAS
jgi:tetratricopeptide (TPR) repeat protein